MSSKKLFLSTLIAVLLLSACEQSKNTEVLEESSQEPTVVTTSQVFNDTELGLSFEYPKHWKTAETPKQELIFAADTDSYFNGLSDVPTELEKQGLLTYKKLENPSQFTLEAYLDDQIKNCEEMCIRPDVETWEKLEIDGYSAYLSDWKDQIEGDSNSSTLYIVVNNSIVEIQADQRGSTTESEDYIQEVFQKVVDTLKIE